MAMFQLGKLKFRFKDGGMDFRWGEGEVKRIGKKASDENFDDYADSYADYDDDAGMNYGGRFVEDQDYPEDDYADDGYDDYEDDGYDDYAGNGYPEDDYVDDGYGGYEDEGAYDDYEDDYADDGYGDDGYDDRYDDYEEDYDDRYFDEDADDGYADDYEGEYDEYGYEDDESEGGLSGLLQYVDENDWVTYLLLVLLPPLGIYLLWRRQRFEPMIRYAITAASAVWFVVMIILLCTMIFSGHGDKQNPPVVPTLEPTVAASTQPSTSPSATATVAPSATANGNVGVMPSATPIGGAAMTSVAPGSVVWASASGNFYHVNQACSLAVGETLSQTTVENAKNRGKYPCTTCYGGQLYYATAGGSYYHLNSSCSDMDNAEMYTKEMAEAQKKQACPVCVTKTQNTLVKVPDSLEYINTNTSDKSGIKVWCTSGGKNYHMTSGCRGMSGAKQVSLKDALLMGKTACSTCCEVSGEAVYCTKGGTYYHRNSGCSGMTGASKVTVAEALVLGKKECPTCRPVANSNTAVSGNATNDDNGSDGDSKTEEYYVYATKGGKYYHVKKTCSGMSGASKVTLKSMIAEGREACPECCGGAGMSVYATKNGTYYHSYATCSGMSGATQGSLSQALSKGYKRCPRCWGDSNESLSAGSNGSGNTASNATSDTVKVYATTKGKYYHTKSNCSGMKNAKHITLTEAIDSGKAACPTCATTAQKTVYSTNKGKYYHKAETCDNMTGASKRTLAEALKKGQSACPICMGDGSGSETEKVEGENNSSSNTPEKVANFSVGKSGIKVYASPTQKYYHANSSCTSAELSHVALETALNYGRKPCSKCLPTADDKVYATKNGKYYHVSRSCAGSGASSGTLAEALAYGFSPCPYCVTGEKTENTDKDYTYESGRSGIKVYAKADGKYYHGSKNCAGSGASRITLETALNYGMKACQDCCAVAERTVYAVKDSMYYHASKSCAGDGAVKGNYAQALAYGLKACSNCIGGGNANDGSEENDAPEYTAPAESSVYIDLYSDSFYYHRSKSCSGSGMKGGEEVTLEYAKDFGYQRCPHCNPASDVE